MRKTLLLILLSLMFMGLLAASQTRGEAASPSSIAIACPFDKLFIGQTAFCTVEVQPAGSDETVTWTSSNPGCLSVDEKGVLTAKAYGTAVITATASNGAKGKITLSVLKKPQSISLDQTYLELYEGQSAVLHCVFPRDTLAGVVFSSLDEGIVRVDAETGRITAASQGSTAVVATASNEVTANCFITVLPKAAAAQSELEAVFMDVDSNDAILLRCGEEYAFIDGGNHIYGEKATAYLKELGVTHLKYYIGTHAHIDHIGAACVIFSNFDVDMVIVPHAGVIQGIKGSVWTAEERDAVSQATYCVISHGQTFYLGSVPFRCIGPINVRNVDRRDDAENANSMVLRSEVGEISLLLTGDGTIAEFNDIAKVYPQELDVDIFKNTHHSGELTSGQIEMISPKVTIFSTSSLHLPRDGYLNLFTSLGSDVYMTPTRVNGTINLYTDGETITVTPQYEDNRANWYNEITGKPKGS